MENKDNGKEVKVMKTVFIALAILWGLYTLWGIGATIGIIHFSEPVKFPVIRMLLILGVLIGISVLL